MKAGFIISGLTIFTANSKQFQTGA